MILGAPASLQAHFQIGGYRPSANESPASCLDTGPRRHGTRPSSCPRRDARPSRPTAQLPRQSRREGRAFAFPNNGHHYWDATLDANLPTHLNQSPGPRIKAHAGTEHRPSIKSASTFRDKLEKNRDTKRNRRQQNPIAANPMNGTDCNDPTAQAPPPTPAPIIQPSSSRPSQPRRTVTNPRAGGCTPPRIRPNSLFPTFRRRYRIRQAVVSAQRASRQAFEALKGTPPGINRLIAQENPRPEPRRPAADMKSHQPESKVLPPARFQIQSHIPNSAEEHG